MHRVSPLVTTGWLSKVLTPGSQGIRVLDGSWYMPTSEGDAHKDYLEKHIPGAALFDSEKVSDLTSPYSHTVPHPRLFGDYVGKLGITNDTHVIVYDNHKEYGMFSSPRVWWIMRLFGHHRVSVLEGGLPKWISEGHPTTHEVPQIEKTEYNVNFQPQLLKKFEDMMQNLKTKKFQVMDARSRARFAGTVEEPRKGLKLGHIPNSKNIPFMDLLDPETRQMKPPEELKKIFAEGGIDLTKPLTATCGSGITACIISLGAFLSGKEDVSVFDGSWEEYAQRASSEDIVSAPQGPAGG